MKKELKIGILAIVVLAATFFVINFLRGKDILNREYELVSFYGDVQGLLPSSPVYIKGFKAGTVSEVDYDKEKGGFDVVCSISKDFPVPEDSRMTIYSADLMGGKAVRIDLGSSATCAADGARLVPSVSPDMLSSIAAGIEPLISRGSEVLDNLDSALTNLNLTMSPGNREHFRSILENLDNTVARAREVAASVEGRTGDIEAFITNMNSISEQLEAVVAKADSAMSDVEKVAGQLGEADFDEPGILIKISNVNPSEMSAQELYDRVCGNWRVGLTRACNARLAFGVCGGRIVEVYRIDEWLPARQGEALESEGGRYQFVGHLANDELRERYKGQLVTGLFNGQNPIRYVGGA